MRFMCVLVIAWLLQGCVAFEKITDAERSKQSNGVDRHSAYPIVPRDKFEQLNIFYMLDPESRAHGAYDKTARGVNHSSRVWRELTESEKYDLAFKAFYTYHNGDPDKLMLERNRVQDRILSASVGRCNVFKTYMQRDQSDLNFTMGAWGTITGVLGAIIPGVQTARHLSGASGLFSGLRAEFNQSFYSNLAAHVVVRGIAVAQAEAFRRIQADAQTRPISQYTVEAAIKDAVYFDGLCSAVTGMEQASDSIRSYADPGLDSVTRAMIKAKRLQLLSKDDVKTLDDLAKFDHDPNSMKLSIVGIPVTHPVSPTALDPYSAIAKLIEQKLRVDVAQDEKAAQISAAYARVKSDKSLNYKNNVSKEIAAQQLVLVDGLLACIKDQARKADLKTGAAAIALKAAKATGDAGVTEAQFGIAVSEAKIVGIRATNSVDGAVADLAAVLAGLKDDELAKADFKDKAAAFIAAQFKGKTASANKTPCAG